MNTKNQWIINTFFLQSLQSSTINDVKRINLRNKFAMIHHTMYNDCNIADSSSWFQGKRVGTVFLEIDYSIVYLIIEFYSIFL